MTYWFQLVGVPQELLRPLDHRRSVASPTNDIRIIRLVNCLTALCRVLFLLVFLHVH